MAQGLHYAEYISFERGLSKLQEVGLMENATALIDTVESDPNSYVVNFVVKEPKSFTLGLKVLLL